MSYNNQVPRKIVDSMLDLLNDTGFWDKPKKLNADWVLSHRVLVVSESRWADFSTVLLERFHEQLSDYIPNEEKRYSFIIYYLLYVTCDHFGAVKSIRKKLYGEKPDGGEYHGHVYHLGIDKNVEDLYVQEYWEALHNMKFGLVVGNPPYNDDKYIKFVMEGHKFASGYSLWITPDSWRFNEKSKIFKDFRDNIFPYIYKLNSGTSKDIFPSIAPMTIDWYLITKTEHEDKFINSVKAVKFNILDSLDSEIRLIKEKVVNNSSFISMTDTVKSRFIPCNFCRTKIPDFGEKNFPPSVLDNKSPIIMTATNNTYHVNIDCIKPEARLTVNKYSLYTTAWIQENFVSHINDPYNIEYGKNLTLYIGDKDECEYAQSYYSCKLIWFLVYGIFGVRAIHSRYFQFVPQPAAFDHIFTDEELYQKYNITDEEIKVIESVIRERS